MHSHDQASQNASQQAMSPRASFISELARSAFEAVSQHDGYMPTRSPKRSCRPCGTSADASATTHPESGQARVRSGVRLLAPLARPSRLQSRQLGSSPLSAFAAQGTSALTATRRRDCSRRSRPQTRSSPRTNGPPGLRRCFVGTWVPGIRIGVELVRGWYPAGSIGAGSGNLLPPALPLWTKKLSTSAALPWATSLSSLPCWVVPPAKASSPAGRASSLLLSPLQGKAARCARLPWFNDPGCAGGARAGVEALCFYSWGSASSRGGLCPAWALVRAHSFGPDKLRSDAGGHLLALGIEG